MSSVDDLPQFPARRAESHKGDYGRALLVGGSRGMSGAISLAGMACLRSGAGLVKIATADVCLETVAGFDASYMTVPLPCDNAGRIALDAKDTLAELAKGQTGLAVGPGMGQSSGLDELAGWMFRELEQPAVFDADGLNAISNVGLAQAKGPRILTPHPGEFRRLAGDANLPADALADRAVEMAREYGVVIVLKGHHTLITDGQRRAVNDTGNPGMATGGTGDVLTGVITALVCQGLAPFDAARLGVHLHGLAGDLCAEELGEISMTSADLVDFLVDAFLEHADLS